MFHLVTKVQRWLSAARQRSRSGVPYEVACACGNRLRGFRQAKYQVQRCPACSRDVFVLPLSPLPAVVPPPREQ